MAMNAPAEHTERLARFGHDIGRAFQIVDDVFDLTATEGRIGKPVGNDIREGDITLPMLRVMQTGSEADKEELRSLVGKSPITEEEVARALEILRSGDAMEYSMALAAEFIASAKAQLDIFEPSEALNMMYDIADYVLTREK
jgi:geranylgeranyl pyrophosphate synthase